MNEILDKKLKRKYSVMCTQDDSELLIISKNV